MPTRRRSPRADVSTRGGPFVGLAAATVARRAEKMLDELGLDRVELSIALVGDAAIRELNRTYRKKDKATDVLAFPLQDLAKRDVGPKVTGLLGDVVISVETARSQAARRRRRLLDEVTMLLAHGLLHLLGYDHRTDAEEREMTEKTRVLERAAGVRWTARRRDFRLKG